LNGKQRRAEDYVNPWRAELEILAATQMGSALRQKVSPEDVAQEAIIKAVLGWDSFLGDPEETILLRAWLRTILVHEVRESYRRFSTQGRDIHREMSLMIDPDKSCAGMDAYAQGSAADPQDMALRRERFEKLRSALRTLPPDEEQAVVARYLNQMKIKDIAELLQVTEKMASDRVFRGLAKLLKSMGDDDYWASRVGLRPAP